MPRHSKKNSGNAIFTYNEIQYVKSLNIYGEVTTRIGTDFQKKFEQCPLCLHTMVNPVCCLKGHTYCKECLYKDLLYQKKQIKEEQNKEDEKEITDNKEIEQKKAEFLAEVEDVKIIKENTNTPLIAKKVVDIDTTKCFWLNQDLPTLKKEEIKKKKK